MKLRKFHIALHLLLVFLFCLSLTAQVTVDTSTKTPEEKAKDAYDEALHAYIMANNETVEAMGNYLISNDTVVLLQSTLNLANSESSSTINSLASTAIGILDAVGADPLDLITDAGALILQGLKGGWDLAMITKKKSNIEKALLKQQARNQELKGKWDSKKEVSDDLLAKADEAFEVWQELKAVVYTFGPADGKKTIFVGERHIAELLVSKRLSNVKWYSKSPHSSSTGKGRLVDDFDYDESSTSKMTAYSFYAYSVGEYVISVRAEMQSTDEVIEDSYTLTVVPTGITYNQYMFMSDETLVVTVQRGNLSRATMYIDGETKTTQSVDSSGKVVLSYSWSDYLQGRTSAIAKVTIYVYSDDDTKGATVHDELVSVAEAYRSQTTVPDRPKSFSLAKTYYRGQIRLTWTQSDSDGGSPITDYQYQYSAYRSSSQSYEAWPEDWESAGTDFTELISGLRRQTKYRVRMRAKNSEGYSVRTGYKTVTTR